VISVSATNPLDLRLNAIRQKERYMKIKQSYDLTSPKILRNKYYLLRHGESHANREGIVISEPETGTSQYGLTGKGTESVIETAIIMTP